MSATDLAARILTLAATLLHPHETSDSWIPGHQTPACMTDGLRDTVLRDARETVLLPVRRYATVDETRTLVASVLPPVTGTVTEYAALLRETARALTAQEAPAC
ncbi:hypothetical protein [Streptomyces sp. NPDC088812]|uniref:hypothetical protein n=1 Tax=Streptomyces sp. NPDC088812 TaxID=3365905 RepID=UPI0038247C6E